jgi:glycosyltransferase involved in cell wall biosynthesis
MPESAATLHLVGDEAVDASYRRRVLSRLAQADLRGRVVRHGIVEPTAMEGLYDAADAFVLASTVEPYGTVYGEAMAAGLPVVATDTGGLPDLVDGIGTLVPVHDPTRLAEAVEELLRDPAARHTASVQGRERATSWDDGKATASRWHEWYSALPGMT